MSNLTSNEAWKRMGPGPDEGETCRDTRTTCGCCGIRKRNGHCPECAEWEEHYKEQGRV